LQPVAGSEVVNTGGGLLPSITSEATVPPVSSSNTGPVLISNSGDNGINNGANGNINNNVGNVGNVQPLNQPQPVIQANPVRDNNLNSLANSISRSLGGR